MKNFKLESVVIALGLFLMGLCVYWGLDSMAQRSRVVSVRGLAEREVKADHVIWPILFRTTGNNLSEVLSGKAIYIAVTSGGDMTPDGKFATPVMLAYLYEDGKLVGSLPEFGISASIFDFLGKDLIAVAKNDLFGYKDEGVIVAKFTIDKK